MYIKLLSKIFCKGLNPLCGIPTDYFCGALEMKGCPPSGDENVCDALKSACDSCDRQNACFGLDKDLTDALDEMDFCEDVPCQAFSECFCHQEFLLVMHCKCCNPTEPGQVYSGTFPSIPESVEKSCPGRRDTILGLNAVFCPAYICSEKCGVVEEYDPRFPKACNVIRTI